MNIHHKIDDTAITNRLQKIAKKSGNLREPLDKCGEILVSSIMQNFNVQGRFSEPGSWRGGPNKWPQSAAAKRRGGMTLSKSGQLRRSIQKVTSDNQVEVGTNKEYAAAHNFGFEGDVQIPEHTRRSYGRSKSGRKSKKATSSHTVRAHKRHMKVIARTFMNIQEEDIEDMIDELGRYIME
jgi:phage gpG-like protein